MSCFRHRLRQLFFPAAVFLLGSFALDPVPLAYTQTRPQITVTGADEALRDNILSHLRVGAESCNTSLLRLQRLQNQVRSNTENAARALGYYQSTINLEFSRPEPAEGSNGAVDNTCWALQITINPGTPVMVSEVLLDIDTDNEHRELFSEFLVNPGLVSGQQLNHGAYERLKNNLSTRAVENGFFSARFTRSEVRVDLRDNRAVIDIQFAPGPRYRFGSLEVNELELLSDEFVRRLISLEEGAYYSNAELLRLRQNLDDSQYFGSIAINPQLSQASNLEVPMSLELATRPRHVYSAGIGFTTDTGPRLRLAYENRYQTRSGDRLGSEMALSPIRSQLDLNYTTPRSRNPLRESFQHSTGFIHEDTNTYDSNRFELQTAYRNESESGWLRRTFINYQFDRYNINQERSSAFLTILGFNVSRTVADDLINPSQGWRIFSELRGASDVILSQNTFLQASFNTKYVHSLSQRGRVIARSNLGTTWIETDRELPVSLRYFTGGDQSLRGYDFQSLGPEDEEGVVIGGSHLVNGSLEYDYRFRNSWRAAVFYDAGNAFNKSSKIDWKQSVGVGIRWLSPIGPLRFDVARGINDNEGYRIHVTMGPDF